jgi:hypothetical protein
MAKRYRSFKRINLTAKVASLLREMLVDKTFNDHFEKKKCSPDPTGLTQCGHESSGSLAVARLIEAKLSVGKKRGRLDIDCPHLTARDPDERVATLKIMVLRVRGFAKTVKNPRTRDAMLLVAQEIEDYAHRNAMEVLAEQVVDVDFQG